MISNVNDRQTRSTILEVWHSVQWLRLLAFWNLSNIVLQCNLKILRFYYAFFDWWREKNLPNLKWNHIFSNTKNLWMCCGRRKKERFIGQQANFQFIQSHRNASDWLHGNHFAIEHSINGFSVFLYLFSPHWCNVTMFGWRNNLRLAEAKSG